MQTSKLKQLNRNIHSLLNMNATPIEANLPAYRQYEGCQVCSEVRRQNYRLRQEALTVESVQEELEQSREQLRAMRELYELKCREVQLLQGKLEQSQKRTEEELKEREDSRIKTITYFQELLEGKQK